VRSNLAPDPEPMTSKPPIDFDIHRYLRASKRVDLSTVDWEEIPSHPLSDGDVMCMHYMLDIETHTVIYLRDLLATRATNDPHVTAFLSCWVYEELWHGEAFSEFLRAYGIVVPAEPKLPDGSTPMPTRPQRVKQLREKLGVGHQLALLPTMLGSMATRHFVGLHMAWGAINELTTLTAYYALMRQAPDNPVLHQMLRRVIQDERRHYAFYRAQARARLENAPPHARKLVRWVFENLWTPVGAGVKSREEVDALCLYLFSDEEGREQMRSIDRSISELPGLEGLALLEGVLDAAIERRERRPGYAGSGPVAASRAVPEPVATLG
jgi:rubrerythrin